MMCERCKAPMVADHSIDFGQAQGHMWRRIANCRGCDTAQPAERRRQLLFRSLTSENLHASGVMVGK